MKSILEKIAVKLDALDSKMDRLELKVDQNTKDIIELYKIINMGKGGVKVLVWVGTIIIAILGWKYSQ
tara:strand:+ start:479 stop:682 length:204 start_codon:yes stop_codon:yes gene_type:complete